MDKQEAIAKLRSYDHAVVSGERAWDIALAFGVEIAPRLMGEYQAGRGRIERGPDCDKPDMCFERGEHVCKPFVAVDAALLAEHIARQVADHETRMNGIGSRLRDACDSLEKAASEA